MKARCTSLLSCTTSLTVPFPPPFRSNSAFSVEKKLHLKPKLPLRMGSDCRVHGTAGDQWNALVSTSFTFYLKKGEEEEKLQEADGRQRQQVEGAGVWEQSRKTGGATLAAGHKKKQRCEHFNNLK